MQKGIITKQNLITDPDLRPFKTKSPATSGAFYLDDLPLILPLILYKHARK